MADVFDRAKRSEVMRRIRSANNQKTEISLLQFFRAHKITGWRRRSNLYGHPDFVFPRLRLAVFVDGCFWHLCPLHAVMPKTRRMFWKKKLLGNRQRDKVVTAELKRKGWRVLRIWEHELKLKYHARLLKKIHNALAPAPVSTSSRAKGDSRAHGATRIHRR